MELLQKVAQYVTTLFEQEADEKLVYHNLWHTQMVVAHTEELIDFYRLSEEERFVVQTAAWFHDTGHLFNKMHGHEEVSATLMRKFLIPLKCKSDLIFSIADCIMATKMPSNPLHLTEQVLCDADTWHLGTEDFMIINKKVRAELYLREGIIIEDWTSHSIGFLTSHRYFTGYCKEKLNPGKEKNIAMLENQL